VTFGKNTAPEGSYLWSAGEALAQTYCILFITALIVTAVTVSFQFYAGVRWDQAIVNDWEVRTMPCFGATWRATSCSPARLRVAPNLQGRTSAKFMGCVARQLSGTASNSQSNAVAITDFVGLVF